MQYLSRYASADLGKSSASGALHYLWADTSLLQMKGQGEGGERNRPGETSGKKDDIDCPGQTAKCRTARELGEVDELFSKLRKKVKAIRAQPSKVRGHARHRPALTITDQAPTDVRQRATVQQAAESKQAGHKKRKVAGDKEDIFGKGSARPYRSVLPVLGKMAELQDDGR